MVSDYLLLLLFTGLRRNEAATLRFDDIDFVDRTLTIPDTKNGEPLTLPLSDFLVELLERRARNATGGYVFPGTGKEGHLVEPKRHVQRVVAASGVPFMLHDLRRTFAYLAYKKGMRIADISRQMRHSSIAITQKYIGKLPDFKKSDLSCYLILG